MTRQAETITGQIRELRLIREGWGIAQIALGSDDRTTPVTGTMLAVDVGDTVEATGTWTTHSRFGRQFKADRIVSLIPSTADDFITWLSRRLPNVGRRRAAAIVQHFGGADEAHRALLDTPERLVEIDGITDLRAEKIGVEYRQIARSRDRQQAFIAYGLTDRQIARVEEKWGREALDILREDPYRLLEEIDGFGFKRADAVALRMGVSRTHPSRIVQALLFLLGEAETAGHTYVTAPKLVALAAGLLEVDDSDVWPHVQSVCDGRRAVDRKGWIFRAATDRAEGSVASSVASMLGAAA